MATVLLIEDDRWLADCFNVWLTADGHKVHYAADVYDAMDIIDTAGCDIIILDLFLSYTNGVQLLHTLQSYPDVANIPVVLCSASLINVEAFEAYGVRQVLDKATLSPAILRSAIQKGLTYAAI